VAFALAISVVLFWALTGPILGFSDTWQLIINTGTTIVTFLVFLIQNTQNRDNQALHAKLDELILATTGADNRLMTAEDLSDEQLERLHNRFERIANHRQGSRRRTRTPDAIEGERPPEGGLRPTRGADPNWTALRLLRISSQLRPSHRPALG